MNSEDARGLQARMPRPRFTGHHRRHERAFQKWNGGNTTTDDTDIREIRVIRGQFVTRCVVHGA